MGSPTFLILGAQKAGTTWLADMVRQHPEICMPETKELHFFNKRSNIQKGLSWYEAHFEACTAPGRGEATPNYLWYPTDPAEIEESGRVPNVPARVHEAYPDLKFIVSLRNPVDRAVSAYRTLIRGGYISPQTSIIEAAHRHGILSMGEYQMHIEKWLTFFPRERFLFLVFEEDVKQRRQQTMETVFNFLDVNTHFVPEGLDERKHPSLGAFYEQLLYYAPWIRTVVKAVVPNLNRERIPFRSLLDRQLVSDDERAQLTEYFVPRNEHLASLIDRTPEWHPIRTEEPSA